jgi:hypothetical protein
MADTPFAESFGDPRKYMNQNPGLVEAGKALKTGAAIWGLQQTGVIDALDKMGVKPTQSGGFSFSMPNSPAGSVAPVAPPALGAAPPVNPNAGAFAQQAQNQVNLNQSMNANTGSIQGAAVPQPSNDGVVITPVNMGSPPAIPMTMPPDAGKQLLDGSEDWLHGSVNPQASHDSLVLPPQQTAEAPRLTGNEYQQVPGYGSLKKAAAMMAGMG